MDFHNIELMKTGTWHAASGEFKMTREIMDEMITTAKALGASLAAPIKLGHDDKQDLLASAGLPAAGWITNLRRDSDSMFGSFVGVPDGVSKLIENGGYAKRSIEAQKGLMIGGKKQGWALTACALLGADIPAVDSLDDIVNIYAKADVAFSRNVEDGDGVIAVVTEGKITMPDMGDTPDKIKAEADRLVARLTALGGDNLSALVTSVTAKFSGVGATEMDIEAVRKALGMKDDATEEEVLARMGELHSASEGDKGDEGKTEGGEALETVTAELSKTRKEVIELQLVNATTTATNSVDDAIKAGRAVPASRDTLVKMAIASPKDFDDFVKATPEGTVINLGEKGTSDGGGGDDPRIKFALTDTEKEIARQLGTSEEDAIKAKASEAGVEITDEPSGKDVIAQLGKAIAEAAKT